MPAFDFPNLDTLRLVLASGTLPYDVTDAPAQAAFDDRGRLRLKPTTLPSREMITGLNRLGVRLVADSGQWDLSVCCWAELLPLRVRSTQIGSTPAITLFVLNSALLAHFVARIRRFSPAPVALRFPTLESVWLTVANVPPIVLLETLEGSYPIEPFIEHSPHIWVRLGWEHPVPARLLTPRDGTLLLRPEREHEYVDEFVPLPHADDFPLARQPVPHVMSVNPRRIVMPLKLVHPPQILHESLWVFSEDNLTKFQEFCRNADQRGLRRYEIASQRSDAGVRYVLRGVPGKKPPPLLPLSISSYAPHPRVPGLFVPADRCLKPDVRSHELTDLFGLGSDRIAWLETGSDDRFVIQTVLMEAFRPLAEMIRPVLPPAVPLTTISVTDELFLLPQFMLTEEQVQEDSTEAPKTRSIHEMAEQPLASKSSHWLVQLLRRLVVRFHRSRTPHSDRESATVIATDSLRPHTHNTANLETHSHSVDALLHGRDWAARRHALESSLLTDWPRLEPPQRGARWAELATVYGATRNATDAAVCWINAVWEVETVPKPWLDQWLLAECRAAKLSEPSLSLDRILGEPRRFGMIRTLAAFVTRAAAEQAPQPELSAALTRIHTYLDQHFDDLSARAAWLVRVALTKFAGRDALGLAQWHDRLIHRLRERGPALDLDEPAFLRFHGTASSEQFQTARDWLTKSGDSILDWIRKLTPAGRLQWAGLDPETDCTAAYARLMLAWGLGHLGERSHSRDWAARARKVLAHATGPGVDPAVHTLLAALFAHRTRAAQEGRSAKPGLPAELLTRYDSLSGLSRYAVDKLRRFSRILEPWGRVHDYRGHELRHFWGTDLLGERLSILVDCMPGESLMEEARQLLKVCSSNSTSNTVPRITLTLLDLAAHLDASVIPHLLELVPPALQWMETWLQSGRWTDAELREWLPRFQARILENAFAVATQFEQHGSVQKLVEYLLRHTPSDTVLSAALTQAASAVFRFLRKQGQLAEAEHLLNHLDPRQGQWPKDMTSLPSRLGLVMGWFSVGNEDAGNRILNTARDQLFLGVAPEERDRTDLAIAYAAALASAPSRIALGRLEEIFQRLDHVTLIGTTNRYYSLKVLELIDTVVRAVVTEDFTLSTTVRNWLDDDEFLIRRRIHRDLAHALREDGIN